MSRLPYLPIDDEIWKPIPGYDDRYEASDRGRIRCVKGKGASKRHPRLLAGSPGAYGYVYASLVQNGKKLRRGIHQFIALAFHGPCPEGLELDHKDRNKNNNRPDNLEYVTHQENIRRARISGSWNTARGERSGNAKLTDAAVRAIRHDARPQRVVAAEHGISGVAVCLIRQRKSWKHVED
jgi:hypothetical protein